MPLCYGTVRLAGTMIYSNQLQAHWGGKKGGGGKGKGGASDITGTCVCASAAPRAARGWSSRCRPSGRQAGRLFNSRFRRDNTYCALRRTSQRRVHRLSMNMMTCLRTCRPDTSRLASRHKPKFSSTGLDPALYDGWEDQAITVPLRRLSAAITPAYRGVCYLVLDDMTCRRRATRAQASKFRQSFHQHFGRDHTGLVPTRRNPKRCSEHGFIYGRKRSCDRLHSRSDFPQRSDSAIAPGVSMILSRSTGLSI